MNGAARPQPDLRKSAARAHARRAASLPHWHGGLNGYLAGAHCAADFGGRILSALYLFRDCRVDAVADVKTVVMPIKIAPIFRQLLSDRIEGTRPVRLCVLDF